MRRYDIVLDHPNKIFFSGDDVSGHVAIVLDSKLTVQGVTIRLVGEACVSVPNENNRNQNHHQPKSRQRRSKISPSTGKEGRPGARAEDANQGWVFPRDKAFKFCAVEKYFHHKEYLFGHKYSSYREQLWEGSHCFPFHYTLPAQLPASFNGRFGYVRYYCESSLERWRTKETRRVYFSVCSLADINHVPKADSACSDQKSTNSCLFCVPRGTIIASSQIRRRGYVSGEVISLSTDVHNMSNATVLNTTAAIIQVVTYSCGQGLRQQDDERAVQEHRLGPVQQGQSEHWVVHLTIPPVAPTSFGSDVCKLIVIQYRLDVSLEIDGLKEPLVLQMPLLIGNIPLRKCFKNLETETDYHTESQFTIPFKIHKHKGLRTGYQSLDTTQTWSERSTNPPADECVYAQANFNPCYPYYREKPKSAGRSPKLTTRI